jgi:hypothetical protein
MPPGGGAVVPRQLDEVDRVRDRNRAREVGEEDEARLQQRDEQQVAAFVIASDVGAELADARVEFPGREEDVAYSGVWRCYDARSSR